MENLDTRAPYVEHRSLKVIFISDRSFSIRWEKAKDKVTASWRIRYVVGLKENDNANDSWHIVAEEMDMDTFTFQGPSLPSPPNGTTTARPSGTRKSN